jgi:large subunit ribosomal protein L9
MAKELILTTDVEGLGIVGDVVKVSEGYARNFLLPKRKATAVSDVMKQRLAKARAEREVELAQEKEVALKFAEKIAEASVTITARTNEEGHLYGAVNVSDIVDAAVEQGLTLNKKHVHIDEPIKETGVFSATVILHPEVKASLKVWVVEE